MVKINNILAERLRKKDKQSKMRAMAQSSSEGRLSGFSGIFGVSELDGPQIDDLRALLEKYAPDDHEELENDLSQLAAITGESRAISNQAAILHGERIKKVQGLLRRYKEGAFSHWLTTTYGNRQTPYNFLHYYELYSALPRELHQKMQSMPRQAVYVLASRDMAYEEKRQVIESYEGQSKTELLQLIRQTYPLGENDQRSHGEPKFDHICTTAKKLQNLISQGKGGLTETQRDLLVSWVSEMKELL